MGYPKRSARSAMVAFVLATSSPAAAQVRVCVDVEVRAWSDVDAPAREADAEAEPGVEEAEVTGPEVAGPEAAAPGASAPEATAPEVTAPPVRQVSPFDEDPTAPWPGEERATTTQRPGTAPTRFAPPPMNGAAPQLPRGGPLRRHDGRLERPDLYLRRLVEFHVTHRRGFEAVASGCAERLTVQFYPLAEGWTVFARYSGHAREEKVDRVLLDEFDALAQRLASALLADVSVQETLTRRTVLRADSDGELRQIATGRQFLFAFGTQMMGGMIPTAPNRSDPARNEFRVLAPVTTHMGMRGVLRAWGIDAYLGIQFGTSRRAASRGEGGGHVDYSFGTSAVLHFFRYLDAPAVSSLYLGGGASFQVNRFRVISGLEGTHQADPEGLWGGGMNLDLVMGYEVLRASALHFFVELDAYLPTYAIDAENDAGGIRNHYLPSLVLQIGLLH